MQWKKKVIKVADGTDTLYFGDIDAEDFFEVDIQLPISVKRLFAGCVDNAEGKKICVIYGGTVENWRAIQKGNLTKIEKKKDFYGYQYHNAPVESVIERKYNNWIEGAESVKIYCADNIIDDDAEENEKNPAAESFESYWAD